MREPGIRGCTPNAQKHTAIPNSKAKPRPTWCGATSPAPRPPTGPWTTSRTCAPAGVAVPLDGHRPDARIVVGWSFSGRTTADIVISAPASAKSRCYVPGNALFHADRGAQYTSSLWPSGRAATTCACSAAAPAAAATARWRNRSSRRRRTRCTAGGTSRPGIPPGTR